MLKSPVVRYMSEKNTSVENDVLLYQEGKASSSINAAYTFIPCGINVPINVSITPLKLGSTSANGVAFFTTVVGWQVDSLDVFSSVSDLDNWSGSSVAYVEGNLVEYDGKAYLCHTAHTSSTTFDETKWTALETTTFLKITHTAAGVGKVAHFTYKIEGYN